MPAARGLGPDHPDPGQCTCQDLIYVHFPVVLSSGGGGGMQSMLSWWKIVTIRLNEVMGSVDNPRSSPKVPRYVERMIFKLFTKKQKGRRESWFIYILISTLYNDRDDLY